MKATKAKKAISPHLQPFTINAYNASGEGRWVDLLDPDKNRPHTGVSGGTNIQREYFNMLLRIQFYSMSQLRHILLKINGELATPLMFMSAYQCQDNIIDLGLVRELESLQVFLPPCTYNVHVMGFPAQITSTTKLFDIPRQWCVRAKNESNFKTLVDLTGAKKHGEGIELENIIGSPENINGAKKITISSSGQPGRDIVFSQGKAELVSRFAPDIMQFQASMVEATLRDEMQNIWQAVTELQPYEELMVLFQG